MVGTCATSYTRRECQAAFQLEGKSLVWWDWGQSLKELRGNDMGRVP